MPLSWASLRSEAWRVRIENYLIRTKNSSPGLESASLDFSSEHITNELIDNQN